jgi:hypothetical protein
MRVAEQEALRRVDEVSRRAVAGATGSQGPSIAEAAPIGGLRHALLLFWLLRVAAGLEFIGHGAFGIITKAAWVPYFELVGIPERWAYRLMPLVGSLDIFLGFLVLLKPLRIVLLYMAVWGLWTASLRPLSGEPAWELIERAPNYLVPFALLYLRGLPRCWQELLA